ncbi:MAG: UDP-N-acetylmuramate dehydrogenase [Thermoanaerobaculales bacterium]
MAGNAEYSDGPPAGARENVSLASRVTLELGGGARHFLAAEDQAAAIEGLRWAQKTGTPLAVLGGGSNTVVADSGWDGLVIQPAIRGVTIERDGGIARLRVGAGEVLDDVVAIAVEEGFAGLECLSGIPGWAGATPIQNVGAYGQEIGDVTEKVSALDLQTARRVDLSHADCEFGYRSSRLRRAPGRLMVLEITYRLEIGGAPVLRYPELRREVRSRRASASLEEVRAAVLELRRSKSMILDPADPNRRSVGSFFVNPVLDSAGLEEMLAKGRSAGVLGPAEEPSIHATAGGDFKVSAAWLIEHAGFDKGLRFGAVGISSRHALALVHHGGGAAAELVALAREIRDRVLELFGITLQPEPAFLGFSSANPLE